MSDLDPTDEQLVGDFAKALGTEGQPAEVTEAAKALVPSVLPWRYGDVVAQDDKVYRRVLNERSCSGAFDSTEQDYPWEHFDGEATDQYGEDAVDPARAVLIARGGKLQAEPVTAVSMKPAILGTDQLGSLLHDIAAVVLARDSFGGHLEYEATDEPYKWAVSGAYRVGNSQGQGGMRVIGDLS